MLAIIIPFFKLTYFEATLQSLANQTDKRFRVYIGDDASPEDCSALLQRFEEKIDFTYHRFKTNLGAISLTQQWERCITLSNDEEWIMILGDDDVLGNNVVSEFYTDLINVNHEEINLIRYASQIIDKFGDSISEVFGHPKIESSSDSFWRKFQEKTRSSLSEYIFKREVYLKYKFKNFPLAWHSDDLAWLEFADNKPIFSINTSLIKVRVSSSSISGLKSNILEKNIAESLFLKEIVKNKLYLFNKDISLQLLYQTEVSIKKSRKLSYSEWLYLANGYWNYFSFVPVIKFFRRFLIQLIK